MSKYTTGEMAKLCSISVRTVQFYDTKGLLHPSELTEGGRRLYTDDDLIKLCLICMLKTLGLSLHSIQGILHSEAPAKVLTLLLDEHVKQLDDEIAERQTQLDAIKIIKDNIGNMDTMPVNSINNIGSIVENKKNMRKAYTKLFVLASCLTLIQIGTIVLWIVKGLWIPFVVWLPIQTMFGVLLAKYHFSTAAFICAECNAVFKPPFKSILFTTGTPKARWLTCTKCYHKGYCVEVYVKGDVEQ